MNKIKKGDEVIVIAGKDKGKRGKVLLVKTDKYVVEGVNVVKKATRANPQAGIEGGIISKEMPIHRSNVSLYDPNSKKASRVGIRTLKDGNRERIYKSSGELVDIRS